MSSKKFNKYPIIKGLVFFGLVLLIASFFTLPVKAGIFDDIRGGVSQAGSYFSEGGKTFSDSSSKLAGNALNVWQKVGGGLGEAAGVVVKNTSQASDAFLGGIKNFGQIIGDLGNQVSNGYDATFGKVKQGTDKVAETVVNVLPKKNSVPVVVPKPVVKKDIQKLEAPAVATTPLLPASVVVQPEKNKITLAPKEIIIYSNKANQESVQPLVAVNTKESVSGNYVSVDAAGVATLKGIKIIGTVDFTNADVKGFKQTVVNNYSSGGSSPLVVYNSATKDYETRTSVSGNYGGVSEHFSIGKDLTVGQNATVASGLTIGTASSNGSLTVNGTATITGATTFSGAATLSSDLTVNGNTTLGDAAGDTITINGRLSTLNVSDGSTTSSLAKNSFYIAADSSNALGKFYVDSSGNVSASGTITSSGGLTLSGHLAPSSDNLYDVGSSSTQWRYGNFQGGLLVADGSTTSTLLNNSLILGQASGSNLGKFYVDSSGNVSASGSLRTYGNVTSTGIIYASDGLISSASSTFSNSLNANSLNVIGNVRASSTLLIGSAAGTDNFFVNGATTYISTSTANTAYSLVIGNGSTGALVAGGHAVPSHSALFNLGSDSLRWNNLYSNTNNVSTTLYVGSGGITLSTLTANNLAFAGSTGVVSSTAGNLRLAADGANQLQVWTNNAQRLYVDSSGNTFASGTLQATGSILTYGNVTSTGHIYPATVNTVDLGGLNIAFRDVYASSSINVGTSNTSSTFMGNYLALTNGTSSTVLNGSSLTLGSGTSYNSGMFNVDSNGNVRASGSLQSAGGLLTLTGGTAVTAGSYQMGRDADATNQMHFNVPTGAAYEWSVNDVAVGTLGTTGNFTGTSFNITGSATYGSSALVDVIREYNTSNGLRLRGNMADGATAYGVKLGATTALNTTGAKIVGFYNDAFSSVGERAYIDLNGGATFVVSSTLGYADGRFKINSSGDVSTSGTLAFTNTSGGTVSSTAGNLNLSASNSTLNAIIKFVTDNGLTEMMRLGAAAGGMAVGVNTGYNSGVFNVSVATGNVSTSGTLAFTNTTGGVVSSTVGNLRLAADGLGPNNVVDFYSSGTKGLSIGLSPTNSNGSASTTFASFVADQPGSSAFVFLAQNMQASTTAATDRALAVFQTVDTGTAKNKVWISTGGNVYAKNSFIANSTAYGIADVAEYVNLVSGETGEPGDVLVVDLNNPNQYKKSSSAYSKEIAGVISDTGAFLMGASGEGRAPLALAGLVKTKVTDENGPIAIGDYLVSASKPGYAMKYDETTGKSAGLVGMALEPLTEGEGKITIMVNKGLVAGGGSTSLSVGENGDGTLSGGENWDLGGKNILNVKSIIGANGLWYIDEKGLLMAKEIKADKVQAKKFVVEKEANLKKASISEATISNNNSSVVVENELITPKVKIFITFRSNPNSFWWISKQEDGKFEVFLSKVAEGDLTFDYWIVGVEDAPALETESAPAASVAPIETPSAPTVESTSIVPVAASASTIIIEVPVAPVEPATEFIVPAIEPASLESAPVSDEVTNP